MRCKKCDLNKFSDSDLCSECEKDEDIKNQRDDEELELLKVELEA